MKSFTINETTLRPTEVTPYSRARALQKKKFSQAHTFKGLFCKLKAIYEIENKFLPTEEEIDRNNTHKKKTIPSCFVNGEYTFVW
jgi:hypothetical protein